MPTDTNVVLFYAPSGKYGFLSNFYFSPFEDDEEVLYETVEHYFQSKKSLDPEQSRHIRNAQTPGESKRLGNKVKLRGDWENIKYDMMKDGLRLKFTQDETLKHKLLETGHRIIIEHTPFDAIWGDGGDGSGRNLLGKALMEIREELKV